MECYYLEAFLKVVVLFKEHGVIDDDLWRGDAEVNYAIVNCFGGLNRKKEHTTLSVRNCKSTQWIRTLTQY